MAHFSHEEFTQLVREHQAGLRAFICTLGVSYDWVDDMAQEAFVLAYQKQSDFTPDSNFGAWLRSIARNLVLNEATKRHRRKRILDNSITELLDTTIAPQTEAPDASLDTAERQARLNEALAGCLKHLTARTRSIIEARYGNELSSEQIGLECDKTPSAVRKILFHSRQSLARCIERQIGEVG